MRKKVYLILAIIWMIIIFYLSHQPATVSADQSGNLLKILCNIPVIGVVATYISQLEMADFLVRKSAHMFAYFTLAILLFMYIYDNNKSLYKISIYSFIFTFIYACSDEFHQLFVLGRSGEIRDVLVDSTGAILGLVLICSIMRIRSKYKVKKKEEYQLAYK